MITFSSDPDFFIVRTTTAKQFKEVELLLLSRAIPFTVRNDYWEKLFYIPQQSEAKAIAELKSYLEENKNWPPVERELSSKGFGFSPLHVLVVLCLAYFHWHVTRFGFRPDWLDNGKFIATNVISGEWWRLITALTLHVDDAHLLSNMAGLMVFVSGVGYFVGPGFSWLAVLASAALGNLANALFSQTIQPSIGASTAVFAAVGLVSLFGIRSYLHQKQFKVKTFAPFMAGFGLFAMLGTNPQTDVSAHLFGFLSGAICGVIFLFIFNLLPLRSRSFQVLCFIVFGFFIFQSWIFSFGVN